MRSQGSVGFDETVALTLAVPIQEEWVSKQPLLSGLKGQTKMRTLAAFVCLGLSLWLEAYAQENAPAVYTLKVSADPSVLRKLTPTILKGIVDGASNLLTDNKGYRCNVRFELAGEPAPFPDGTPKDIRNEKDLEAVHQVNTCGNTPHCFDVKVVATIKFCKKKSEKNILGCAWRDPAKGPKTVIVTHNRNSNRIRDILWAHEFGHTTGLHDRVDPNALMSHCALSFATVRINKDDCNCFREGPGNDLPECKKRDPNLECR
jgi:hypothetical protein